jgi:hypothetical protein
MKIRACQLTAAERVEEFNMKGRICTLIKKDNEIFLIYKKIQSGSGAKSYMRKGFLIYEEMRKYLPYMRRPLIII